MRKIQLSYLLILLTCNLYCQSEAFLKYTINDHFLKSDIVYDLNSMIKSIEEVHPNPYHSCSRERIYNLKDSIISNLPDTVSKNLTYLAFKQLTAAYKEGHNDVLLFVSQRDLPKYKESFPLWVELLDIKSPFSIVYLRNGYHKTIKMEGIPAVRYNELYDHLSDIRKQPFEFSILENNIACIEFNNFDYPDKFEKFLRSKMFFLCKI